MKKLLLVRHAKAVHDTSYSDFERPLKHKGVEDATLMAERLKSHSIIPQMLVSSPSIRTEATANIISEHLGISKATLNEAIYGGSVRTILKIINEFPKEKDFIGIVGHNPDISQMIDFLTGEMHDVSPGTVVLIAFEFDDWGLISQNTGKLVWFSSPKDH